MGDRYVEVDFPDVEGEVVELEEGEGEEETPISSSPPFDPVKDAEKIKEIIEWLKTSVEEAEAERDGRYVKFEKWRKQRQGENRKGKKDHPYPNSSNVTVPLSLIIGQNTFGLLKETFGSRQPFWSIKAIQDSREDREDMAVLEKYYHVIAESPFDLALRRKNRTILYDVGTLGTCMVKVPWTKRQWFFKRNEGGVTRQVSSVIHDGPELVPIPYENTIYPSGYELIRELPWFDHKVTLLRHQLEERKTNGIYEDIDLVLEHPRTEADRRKVTESTLQHKTIGRVEEWDLHEIYFYWDSDGDGLYEDIIFTVHMETGTLLRQQWNNIGWRPFEPIGYIHIPYDMEGRGTCQTVEMMQDEADGVHNLRNDNMKLANMRMIAVKKTARMSTRERMGPGKVWFLEDPEHDIKVVQLGEIYPSSVNEERMIVDYAYQACAMPEIMRGVADQTMKSRDTWRGQERRLAQATGLFGSISEGIGDSYSNIGLLIFLQLAEHRSEVIEKEGKIGRLTEEEIVILDRVLAIPVDEIPRRINFTVRTSEADETFDAKRDNLLMLAQITTAAQQQLMPLAQMLLGPQGEKLMKEAPAFFQYLNDTFVGNWKLLREVYELAGEEDVENYVPDMKRQEKIQELLRRLEEMALNSQQLPLTQGETDVRRLPGGGGAPGGAAPVQSGGVSGAGGGVAQPGGAGFGGPGLGGSPTTG